MSDPKRTTLTFLDYTIPDDVDLLYRGDEVVPLEPRPVQVLRYLAERPGRVVSKQELLDRVWPDIFTTDSVLKRAISQCRSALADDPAAPTFIETHHGRGYRFIAPVAGAPPPAPPAPAAPAAAALPHEATTFVGRERDLEGVERLLDASRLVTLTGPGGIGKTRLALRLAHRLAGRFAGGACMVELESLTDAGLVPATVAAALGLREEARPEAIAAALGDRDLLLVLDNCEHLVEACAALAAALLKASERVRVLATSREPLAVAGETTWSVPVLAPDEAARLFDERARAIAPDFLLEENAQAVEAICRRLEGIPLAIELAAARTRALAVDEIAARLDDRFRLLTHGDRTAPARRQTLRAAIDWSYDLLSEADRRTLRWLAIFGGGFGLDAAGAVCPLGDEDPVDAVARLVDKSLVVVRPRAGAPRYALLDTIRQYAAERLAASGEAERAAEAHAAWALGLAERGEALARGPHEKTWLDRLELEHDNVREALRWLRERDDAVGLARLCSAVGRFWDVRGHWDEGREWFAEALAFGDAVPAHLRATLLFGAGMLARHQGELKRAEAWLAESLVLFREAGDEPATARGLNALGNLLDFMGDCERSRVAQEESLAIFERLGDDRGRAMALSGLGMLALTVADYDVARGHYEESLRISRLTGDAASAGIMLHNLGEIAQRQGDYAHARALLEESIEVAADMDFRSLAVHSLASLGGLEIETGDAARADALFRQAMRLALELGDRVLMAWLLECFAWSAAEQREGERALRLAGAAASLREAIGSTPARDEVELLERSLESARRDLGPEPFDDGRRLRLGEAIALAMDEHGTGSGSDRVVGER